jgi:hypothetical protein
LLGPEQTTVMHNISTVVYVGEMDSGQLVEWSKRGKSNFWGLFRRLIVLYLYHQYFTLINLSTFYSLFGQPIFYQLAVFLFLKQLTSSRENCDFFVFGGAPAEEM